MTTTTEETVPSPEVVAWAKVWRRKIETPMRKAGTTFLANASAAVEGTSSAEYRVSGQLDRLANCRTPLEFQLRETPRELRAARRVSFQACRLSFLGVDRFIKGWNQTNFQGYETEESQARVRDGVAMVRKALKLLDRAERLVAKASR